MYTKMFENGEKKTQLLLALNCLLRATSTINHAFIVATPIDHTNTTPADHTLIGFLLMHTSSIIMVHAGIDR